MRLTEERDLKEETAAAHAEKMESEKQKCLYHKKQLYEKLHTISEGGEQ